MPVNMLKVTGFENLPFHYWISFTTFEFISSTFYLLPMKAIYPFILIVLMFSCTTKKQPATVEKNTFPVAVNQGDVQFNTWFNGETMRLDLYHSGKASEEQFATDQVVADGPWAGSKTQLIDKLERGLYFFEVLDRETNTLLYSRGFASIFGEWQTTPEADTVWGTFHESLRFPWPLKPVTVILKKRNAKNIFETIWSTSVDPASRQVNRAELQHTQKIDEIAVNGPAAEKVDIVILGDGYAKNEMQKFLSDARRLTASLLKVEPFKSRAADFNFRAVETPAESSGVCKPHHNVYKRTPLSVHYSSFDSERYALTYDNKTVRDVASAVPYDFMIILINEKTYGGGGIYNLYTTVSADNLFSDYIMVHELGHHMAALADEYYTSSVSYEAPDIRVEPWEPNITAMFDKKNLKWKDLVEPSTPLPTPWNKEAFDAYGYKVQKTRDSLRAAQVTENIMEALFTSQLNQENRFFAEEKYKDQVGAFEGAGYVAKGLYRPQVDCIMFTRHMNFCKVCQRSISQVIDEYVR